MFYYKPSNRILYQSALEEVAVKKTKSIAIGTSDDKAAKGYKPKNNRLTPTKDRSTKTSSAKKRKLSESN